MNQLGPLTTKELPETLQGRSVAIDTESTGLAVWDNDRLLLVQACWSDHSPVWVKTPSEITARELDVLLNTPKRIFLHRAPLDLAALRKLAPAHVERLVSGSPRGPQIWDTKMTAWLCNENVNTGLKFLTASYNPWLKTSKEGDLLIRRNKGFIDGSKELLAYAAVDAWLTFKLGSKQVVKNSNPPGWVRESAVLRLCYEMSRLGLSIDRVLLSKLTAETERVTEDIQAAHSDLNMRSPSQLSERFEQLGLLVPYRTPGGTAQSTGALALNWLCAQNEGTYSPEAWQMLNDLVLYRLNQKLLSTYYRPLSGKMRVHPQWYSANVKTGRLSCSRPNLMSFPKSHNSRNVLVASNSNFVLLSADVIQAEICVAAHYTQDPLLLAATRGEIDIHAETWARVPSLPSRTAAKNVFYSQFYGAGVRRVAVMLASGGGIPDYEKAQTTLDAFKKAYAATFNFKKELGYVRELSLEFWPGRVRHNPGKDAFNSLLQGCVAEIVKDWMLRITSSIPGVAIRAQMHDEVVIEVHQRDVARVTEELKTALNDVNPLSVELKSDVSLWGS